MAPSLAHGDEDWHQVLGLNLTGTFYPCREFVPALMETRGTIVNFSSIAGFAVTRPEIHVWL